MFRGLGKLKWVLGPFEDQRRPNSGRQVLSVSVVLSVLCRECHVVSKSNGLFFALCLRAARCSLPCLCHSEKPPRIFLLPKAAIAILSMAKSSCADRNILFVKMLTNTPFFLNKHFPDKQLRVWNPLESPIFQGVK